MRRRIVNAAFFVLLFCCIGMLTGCGPSGDDASNQEAASEASGSTEVSSPAEATGPMAVAEEMPQPMFMPVTVSGFLGETVEIPMPTPVPLQGALNGTKSTVGEGLRVLVDSIHAHNFLGRGLVPGEYEYHKLHGPCFAVNYLRSRGVAFDEVQEGRITPELLADYDMLFLNLPSAEMPPFYFSEIAAIRNYIESGGAMFVFVDHSNAYFHAYRLAPLFEQLGLEVYLDTACESIPHTLGGGNGWIAVTDFREHPVTKDVTCIGLQTGGAVDFASAIAFTSERSWRDNWYCGMYAKDNAPGCSGNFLQDEGEVSGPMGVVAAKQLGEGRLVVVGDQNMFGDVFINYADNYRLWLNTAAWLLDRPVLSDPEPYIAWQPSRIMFYERYTEAVFGTTDETGFYHANSLIGRHHWIFTGHRLDDPFDLLIFGHNSYELSEDELTAIVRQMRTGTNVLILQSTNAGVSSNTGVVFQIFQALGETSPLTSHEGRAVIVYTESPDHGDVHILGTDFSRRDTGILPPAEREPSSFERPMCENLLQDVRIALGIAP